MLSPCVYLSVTSWSSVFIYGLLDYGDGFLNYVSLALTHLRTTCHVLGVGVGRVVISGVREQISDIGGVDELLENCMCRCGDAFWFFVLYMTRLMLSSVLCTLKVFANKLYKNNNIASESFMGVVGSLS